METVKINLDKAPNGANCWCVNGKQPNGLYIGKMVEKSYIDRILSPTRNNEEYWSLVAKYMSKVYFEMLDECGSTYNIKEIEFDCNGQIYRPK